jgi:hypothetical protein
MRDHTTESTWKQTEIKRQRQKERERDRGEVACGI